MHLRPGVPSPADDAQAYLRERARLLQHVAAADALVDAWTAYRVDQQLQPAQRHGVAKPPIPLEEVEALHILTQAALRELDQRQ